MRQFSFKVSCISCTGSCSLKEPSDCRLGCKWRFRNFSWKFYFKDLKGENHLRYVPNSDHSLRNTDAYESLTAFYDSMLQNKERPRYSWKVSKDGDIAVSTKDTPTSVKLWQATNPDGRDFRLEQIGPMYKSIELMPVKPGQYIGKVDKPAKGYTAYFVEMTFPSGGKYPFKFTSGVVVNPDTYPFAAPVKGQTKLGGRPAKR